MAAAAGTVTTTGMNNLSDEIVLHIIGFINDITDQMNLSVTSTRLQCLMQDFTLVRKTVVPWNVGVNRVTLLRYLGHPDRAAQVTSFTVADLYWVPSGLIRNIALKLSNMKTFRVAGTNFSWKHFVQVLENSKTPLTEISWTWDNELEKKTRSQLHKGKDEDDILAEFYQLKSKLEDLKILVLDIPVTVESLDYTAYTGITKLVSICPNLEILWILSWPAAGRDYFNLSLTIDVLRHYAPLKSDTINLQSLHSLVVSTISPPQIYLPKLVVSILKGFQVVENGGSKKPCQLQFDHPYLDVALQPGTYGIYKVTESDLRQNS